MAKILLGIALAVMLATAALGFLAKQNADKLQTTLSATKSTLTTTQSTLSQTKNDLKTRTDELTAATGKIEEKDKEIATQKGQMDDLNKKITEATTAMEAKTTEVATLTKQLADLMAKGTPAAAGGVEDPIVAALKADVAKAQSEVAESKALIDSLTNKKQEIERQMASLEQYKKSRERNIMAQGTTGRVLAVNSGWNFVVVSIGDRQGAVMNASLLVTRSGEPIAKVRISSVEAATSIADILPGSVRRGVTVQPGDTVVVEGARVGGTAGDQPPQGALPAR